MEAERERERGGADVLAIAQSGMDGRRSDGRAQRGRIDDVWARAFIFRACSGQMICAYSTVRWMEMCEHSNTTD